ncbi:twin-arginine translocation signal domain-containing protein [Salmonella enterica subsp. enterica serovar Kentucky]|nr:twin-arginine translocation signal domain-containing protein [Salmonella enterica subsp. enterica serovar Kentucky]
MSNETGHLNRRSFLKGIVALGAVAALPGGLLTSRCAFAQPPVPFNPKTYKIYRNACPRNCYDTCSLDVGKGRGHYFRGRRAGINIYSRYPLRQRVKLSAPGL